MTSHARPTFKPTPPARFAIGTCDGKTFRIRVAQDETLAELKAHFRATVGHDKIVGVRWFWERVK